MATLITKNSSTVAAVPGTGDLVQGELAVNVTDKKVYTKDSGGSIVKLVGSLGNQEANAPTFTGPLTTNGSTGTSGQVLVSQGSGSPAQWAALPAAVNSISFGSTGLTPNTATTGSVTVAGTLAVSSGGTGVSSLTANNVLLGNGTSAVQVVAPGTTGNVLTSNGTTWVSQAATSGLSGQTDSATPFETSLGYQAGNVSTGINNTFVGYQAGLVNSSGTHNTALGWTALDANTTGGQNTAIGAGALSAASTLIGNVAVGSLALSSLTTLSNNNTAVGWEAGKSYSPSSGVVGGLTAVGAAAAGSTTTGTSNTAVGSYALTTNTTGSNNTAIGFEVCYLATSTNNTGVGVSALRLLTTGANNTVIGASAATNLTTGSNNIVIGSQAAPSSNTVDNEITLGATSVTAFRIPGLSITAGVKYINQGVLTVATLPAAGTAGAGARAFVSDANSTTFASIVAGGGANNIPVYSDGTNWRIG